MAGPSSVPSYHRGEVGGITCRAAADLEAPAFDALLARAVASYQRPGKTGALVAASELP